MRAPTALVLLAAVALAACQKAEQPDQQTATFEIDESAPPQTPEAPPEPRSREAAQRAEELLPEGSSPDAVVKLLGEPESKEGGVWNYGFNYRDADITVQVAFGSDGKVSKVKMTFEALCM
ncbi:MAG: hypothetical protein ACYSU0_16265 [Planctomycetota bacterium]|jgi:outer membrane protein assembly factor BamE (lipoprotein component of BamABCDE complex)